MTPIWFAYLIFLGFKILSFISVDKLGCHRHLRIGLIFTITNCVRQTTFSGSCQIGRRAEQFGRPFDQLSNLDYKLDWHVGMDWYLPDHVVEQLMGSSISFSCVVDVQSSAFLTG